MTLTAEEQKSRTRHLWDGVTEGWERRVSWYRRAFAPVLEWCSDAAGSAPGREILDLACGIGEPALTAAGMVGPTGRVTGVDLAPAMVAAAERQARALGMEHATFRVMDAEALEFPDRAFDGVMCSSGLMFFPAPHQALAEMRRVLRPGGRLGISVWDDPARNTFFTVLGRARSEGLGAPHSGSGTPGPFRFADEREVVGLVTAAGFEGIVTQRCAMTIDLPSIDAYIELLLDTAAGLRGQLNRGTDADRARFDAVLRDAAAPFAAEMHLRLTATALCLTAGV